MKWMVLPLRRYAEFSGRSRRLEYWMFTLFNLIVLSVIMVVFMAGGMSMAEMEKPELAALAMAPALWFGLLLLVVWVLVMLVPGIAVTVRRLHDRDMSGWWYAGYFVVQFVPFVNMIATIAFFVLMVLPGTSGPNRYGPDPKDPNSVEVFA